jgi:raffinose synthase
MPKPKSASATISKATLAKGALVVAGAKLFAGIHENLSLEKPQPTGGAFLRARWGSASARWTLPLGKAPTTRRFTACHRSEPFWMKPVAGTDPTGAPVETQFLLLELDDGRVAAVVPLVDAPFRASLQGKDGNLAVVVETGDPRVLGTDTLALYVGVGEDPYELLPRAARDVMARMRTGRLRSEKPLPAFADVFGWCTWDAFYQDVTQEKVRTGLKSFAKGGVKPRMMILDDGWQSERTMPTGERRLTGFPANAKFPGDLAPTVRMAKQDFGIETFLVWHAFHGYWAGVDGEAMREYGVREVARSFGPGILHYGPNTNIEWWGALVGLVPPEQIHRFYHDYHRHLRAQGVDGVKVDNQATTEGLGSGSGGRVRLMQSYREALESSVGIHFGGNLINCMSCANEMLYAAYASTLTRSSTDFWPNIPSSHGLHLYTNAQVGAWFGEFCWPDWDMFQSGHPMGAFHAAGRAVSGAPVYVSDKPEAHDFALLRKLVCSDGSTLRARDPGRPTRDCLFRDPTKEDLLLKIFSANLAAGVVGAFNARHHEDKAERRAISGDISPSDVPGLAGAEFAIYAHHAESMSLAKRAKRLPIKLDELTAEVFTIVPIDGDVAPIGLADKLNSSGAITAKGWQDNDYVVALRDGGAFVAYAKKKPRAVLVDGKPAKFDFEAGFGVRVALRKKGAQTVALRY